MPLELSTADEDGDDLERPWLYSWEHLPKRTAGSDFSRADYRAARKRAIEVARTTLGDELWSDLQRDGYLELPSTLFDYAALGKPLLAGVAGYAARCVRDEVRNAAVFSPCNVAEGVAAFESLELVERPRPEFVAKYARRNIALAMADDILALGLARNRGAS